MSSSTKVNVCWLGTVPYLTAFETQILLKDAILSGKCGSTILFLEHPPVVTLGASYQENNLLLSREEYRSLGIDVQPTDRGGDVTYHGPGQLVAYPVLNLRELKQDLHWYIRQLETAFVIGCRQMGVQASPDSRHSGIWVEDAIIGSIGIKVSRWITMHGVALNCSNDLTPFQLIHPCGIKNQAMTSMSQLLNRNVNPMQVLAPTICGFEEAFSISCQMGSDPLDLLAGK